MSRCAHCLCDKTDNIRCDASHVASMLYLFILFWMVPFVSLFLPAFFAACAGCNFSDFDFDMCFASTSFRLSCAYTVHSWTRKCFDRLVGKRHRSMNRCRWISGRRHRLKKIHNKRHLASRRQRSAWITFALLCTLCGCSAVSFSFDVWTHTAKQRNKLIHAMNGNGGGPNPKGKE